jgi:hypothetical protein
MPGWKDYRGVGAISSLECTIDSIPRPVWSSICWKSVTRLDDISIGTYGCRLHHNDSRDRLDWLLETSAVLECTDRIEVQSFAESSNPDGRDVHRFGH